MPGLHIVGEDGGVVWLNAGLLPSYILYRRKYFASYFDFKNIFSPYEYHPHARTISLHLFFWFFFVQPWTTRAHTLMFHPHHPPSFLCCEIEIFAFARAHTYVHPHHLPSFLCCETFGSQTGVGTEFPAPSGLPDWENCSCAEGC